MKPPKLKRWEVTYGGEIQTVWVAPNANQAKEEWAGRMGVKPGDCKAKLEKAVEVPNHV